jgi:DNA-binding XRE family transcriptional regulator
MTRTHEVGTAEMARRVGILRRTFKALEKPCDEDLLDVAMTATSRMTVEQLEASCLWVCTHPPKGPLIAAIVDSVDAASRERIRAMQARARTFQVVPYIKGATEEQVQRFRRPAGEPWSVEDYAHIYCELGLPAPAWIATALANGAAR